jgi:hypothetical protein
VENNPLYTYAASRRDRQNVGIVAKTANIPDPFDSIKKDGYDTAILDNPEMFATVPGHFDKSLVDTPIAELDAMYKDNPEGLPVSGDDLAKMGSSNLKPGGNLTTFRGMPTGHIYITAPSDRAQDPNRRFNLEDPDKGTD